MALGFTPKFEQSYNIDGLPPQHYLVIAIEAAKNLKWDISYLSKHGFVAYIGGGIFSTSEELTVIIRDNTVNITSKTISQQMADWGKNKKHVEAFSAEFGIIQASSTNEQLDEKFDNLSPTLPADEDDELIAPPPTAKENFKSFLSLFLPRTGYFITPIIININLIIFVLMVVSGVSFINPTTGDLLAWGANFRAATLAGGWWRLLSSIFLHGGIFHLFLNMYALLYIGLLLEPFLGRTRFLTAYLLTGILASLTSVYWHPLTVSVGASGAIFGMYGVFLAMLTTNFIDKSVRKALLTSIGIFVVMNLANGVKAGIDNAAHIGGLVSGLIMGYLYYPGLKKPQVINIKYITVALITLATFTVTFVVLHQIPNDIAQYEAKMNDFMKKEDAALEVFRNNGNDNKRILSQLSTGLIQWNENLQIINDLDKLELPAEIKDRDLKLKRYCQLRIKSYELIYKAVSENNNQYRLK